MHKLNVKIIGPSSFLSTLNELEMFLKFNCLTDDLSNNPYIILFHVDALSDKKLNDYIKNNKSIKISAGNRKDLMNDCDANLELPATLKEINFIVENTAAKKKI